MHGTGPRTRRQFLAGLTVGIVGTAGCAETETDTDGMRSERTQETAENPTTTERQTTAHTDSEESAATTETVAGEPTTTGADSPAGTTEAGETLDQREANVVGVELESVDGGIRFSVALNHDDNGEDGYANWWQVERRDGTRLGRRELTHAHTQQPFRRSATIEIPEDVSCVVVRGHDQTHGYGGRAMVVNVQTGAIKRVEQGTEPMSIDAADCP